MRRIPNWVRCLFKGHQWYTPSSNKDYRKPYHLITRRCKWCGKTEYVKE